MTKPSVSRVKLKALPSAEREAHLLKRGLDQMLVFMLNNGIAGSMVKHNTGTQDDPKPPLPLTQLSLSDILFLDATSLMALSV